ncbi:carbohydrate esterase family 8 protein [Plicaturopsis crispa FD-325 SS-3]|nr:carbohydrate esterase family 8 protein [Plicaturopsis crispa FD-325 SS-3]
MFYGLPTALVTLAGFCYPAGATPLIQRASTSGTQPSAGDVTVCKAPMTGCDFSTISAAVAALPSAAGSIFVYPGTYTEQVVIKRNFPTTIQGYTVDRTDYTNNQVTITNDISATAAGSNDLSGTVRAESDDITLYNLNIENTFGHFASGCQCQAMALSARGNRGGFYGVNLTGYQDTLLADAGAQVYAHSRIAGAVDFIFGQSAPAYFYKDSIESTSPGCITAPGGETADAGQIYVFEQCQIIPAASATSNTTGAVFLGRPWKAFGKSIFRDSFLDSHLNPAGWKEWSDATPNTADSVLAEFNNTGPGASVANRASFTKILTSDEAEQYTIQILGSDLDDWVDGTYLT